MCLYPPVVLAGRARRDSGHCWALPASSGGHLLPASQGTARQLRGRPNGVAAVAAGQQQPNLAGREREALSGCCVAGGSCEAAAVPPPDSRLVANDRAALFRSLPMYQRFVSSSPRFFLHCTRTHAHFCWPLASEHASGVGAPPTEAAAAAAPHGGPGQPPPVLFPVNSHLPRGSPGQRAQIWSGRAAAWAGSAGPVMRGVALVLPATLASRCSLCRRSPSTAWYPSTALNLSCAQPRSPAKPYAPRARCSALLLRD